MYNDDSLKSSLERILSSNANMTDCVNSYICNHLLKELDESCCIEEKIRLLTCLLDSQKNINLSLSHLIDSTSHLLDSTTICNSKKSDCNSPCK